MDVKLRAFPGPAGGQAGRKGEKEPKKRGGIFFDLRHVLRPPPPSHWLWGFMDESRKKHPRPHNSVFTSVTGPGLAAPPLSSGTMFRVGKREKSLVCSRPPLCPWSGGQRGNSPKAVWAKFCKCPHADVTKGADECVRFSNTPPGRRRLHVQRPPDFYPLPNTEVLVLCGGFNHRAN